MREGEGGSQRQADGYAAAVGARVGPMATMESARGRARAPTGGGRGGGRGDGGAGAEDSAGREALGSPQRMWQGGRAVRRFPRGGGGGGVGHGLDEALRLHKLRWQKLGLVHSAWLN